MEQRKVLLIIVSVTIILAATIGVGIWLFYPRRGTTPTPVASAEGGLEFDALDFLRGDGQVPGLEEEPDEEPDDGLLVVEERRPGVITVPRDAIVNGPDDEPARPGRAPGDLEADIGPAGTADGATTARPAPTRESDATGPTATQSAPEDDEPRPSAATPSPSRTTTTASPPSAIARTTRAPVTVAPSDGPSPGSVRPGSSTEFADRAYWVQVISSPNRTTVENAQRTLREQQLGTRILTKEIGGTIFYRLRLGPFAVREEAEKFLDWVTGVDGFEGSMIFVDYTTRVLAAATD